MRKVAISSLFLILCLFSVNGQNKFFKLYADNGYDFGQGIVQLSDSSYVVTGASTSFQDSPSQVFMLKVDKSGNHEWSKHYGGEESDYGRRVLSWNDSVFYLLGYTNSFGQGGFDLYMVKVDKFGNELGQKTYGYEGWDRLNDALLTPDSSIVMVGESTSTSTSNRDFYIVKTDKNGDTLWTRKMGSDGDDFLNAVLQYDATTFYAVGGHYNQDSSLVKAAVVKFNDQGDVLWLKEFGGYGEYYLNDFYLKDGKLFAGGTRKHPTDGDQDEFLLRIFDDGSYFMYDAEVHKPGDVEYVAVTLYGAETNAYVVSEFRDEFSANNSQDAGYTRFNNDLDWEWGNPSVPFVIVNFMQDDEFGEIVPTSDGGWVSTGYINSQEHGGSLLYILKVGPNDDFPVLDLSNVNSLVSLQQLDGASVFGVYPNPAQDLVNIRFMNDGNYKIAVSDVNGRVLYTTSTSGSTTLFVEAWERGVYLLAITDEAGRTAVTRVALH
ncbi:MAG: T9SS type A sorting domain-containing protein [Bacteroidota bacterium]